jgi:hypothetical protein
MALPTLQPAFAAGELAPALWGREDLSKLHIGATTIRNCFVSYRGGVYSRGGTAFVGRCKESAATNNPPRLIPFQFSISQAYALEFGAGYMRVVYRGGYVTEAPIAVTAVTLANPGMMTVSGSFATGDWIFIANAVGMTELNGNTYIVGAPGGAVFPIEDLDGNPVDTTGFPAYGGSATASRIFTLATPYQTADLPLLKYAQSADVMSLTHPSYPPMELSRLGATNWTLTAFTTQSSIGPPAGPPTMVVNTSASGTMTEYAYVITAVDGITNQESIASVEGRIASPIDIAANAGSIMISWPTVSGAGYYNVYKAHPAVGAGAHVPLGSLFGWIGFARGLQFVDDNIVPDFSQSPPLSIDPFGPGQILSVDTTPGSGYTFVTLTLVTATGSGAFLVGLALNGGFAGVEVLVGGRDYVPGVDTLNVGGDGTGATATLNISPLTGTYPSVVSYFQERRVYANTNNNPDTLFFSQPGAFHNFDHRLPTVDSDAITVSPFAQQVNGVQWMISESVGLVTLTGEAAWQIVGSGASTFNPQPVTPSNTEALAQAFNGANPQVIPLKINYDILYVPALGSAVRDLAYNFFTNLYTGTDITVLSSHLFTGYQIRQWAWCNDPHKLAWAVRDDGTLLCLTFMKEQEITAWARADTQGQFWDVCSIAEPPADAAYFVTARQRPGKPRAWYIERMDNRIWPTIESSWCVDCGLTLHVPSPDANLSWDAQSGVVNFTASQAVFSPDHTGEILRAIGGIARITGFTDTTHITGVWAKSPNLTYGPPYGGPVLSQQWNIGPQYSSVAGLSHLAGLQVIGLADGVPVGPFTVPDSGVITLPFPASAIVIGLAFLPQFQSVYLDEGQPTIQGRRKNIFAVSVRTDDCAGQPMAGSNQPDASASSPPAIGATWSGLAAMPNPATPYTTPGGATAYPFYSGDVRVVIKGNWAKPGQVAIEQDQPLPLSITAIIPEVLVGDLPEAGIERPGAQSQERATR